MYLSLLLSILGYLQCFFEGQLFSFQLKTVSLYLLQDRFKTRQFLFCLLFILAKTVNIFLQYIITFLCILHYLFDEFNTPVFFLHLVAMLIIRYLSSIIFSIFSYICLYFECSSINFWNFLKKYWYFTCIELNWELPIFY